MNFFSFFLFLALFAIAFASEVVILNNDNFEHLTQASTGATTGDWLIKFYAPWCKHCKTLEPIYDEVAEQLKGEINVAKVDVTANRALGSRFDIKGFPTVKFLKQGKVYTYRSKRTVENLVEFARGGYQSVDSEEVQDALGIFGEFKKIFGTAIKNAQVDLKNKKYLSPNILLVSLPLIFLLIFILIIVSPSPAPAPASSQKTKKDKKED